MRRLLTASIAAGVAAFGLLAGTGPAEGTFPGPNGRIVFQADNGHGFELYTIRPDGTRLHRLTHLRADALQADWSPGGRRIAFDIEGRHGRADLAVMRADGSHRHVLRSGQFRVQPAFTPDGHHLLYECDCHPQGIFIMRADGSNRHRVTTHAFPDEGDSDPNISPDGHTVTFVRHQVDGELQALYAVSPSGSNVRQLVPYEREVAIKHDWAPDGRHIVITVDADYPSGRSPNVATIRSDGSGYHQLTHFTGGTRGAFAGSYSPDGRWIVYRVENLEQESYRMVKVHPDGTGRTLIARLPFSPRGMDWGPR